MFAARVLMLALSVALLQGCTVGDAARVLVRGLPDRILPEKRDITLSIYGGSQLNARFEGDPARPLRMCVYFHRSEDWRPPMDLSAACANSDGREVRTKTVTLVADRVAHVAESVPYLEGMWVTVTADFALQGGRGVVKMESPARVDTCHWLTVDRNHILEVKKNSAGNQPTCK